MITSLFKFRWCSTSWWTAGRSKSIWRQKLEETLEFRTRCVLRDCGWGYRVHHLSKWWHLEGWFFLLFCTYQFHCFITCFSTFYSNHFLYHCSFCCSVFIVVAEVCCTPPPATLFAGYPYLPVNPPASPSWLLLLGTPPQAPLLPLTISTSTIHFFSPIVIFWYKWRKHVLCVLQDRK